MTAYDWTQESGDTVVIDAADSATATFTMPTKPQSENFVFKLTVTDNGGLTASDSTTVDHENTLPTADAGLDQNRLAGVVVILNGSADDSDGVITSYSWTQTSGDSVEITDADQVKARFTLPSAPESLSFEFMLTVNDNRSASVSDSVTVMHKNTAPTVAAGADQSRVAGATVVLGGSADDVDGDITSFSWRQNSGDTLIITDPDQATATVTLPDKPQSSSFKFVLTATDNRGESSSDSITILHDNALPVVSVGDDQSAAANTLVALVATAQDSDGEIASYSWTQTAGDTLAVSGAGQLEASVTLPRKPKVEAFVFSFTATDNHGGQSSDSLTVAHINAVPTVTIDSPASVEVGQTLILTGTARDSDGDIASYQWRQTAGVSVAIVAATERQMSIVAPTPLAAEPLAFSLTVTDNRGATTTASVSIATLGQISGTVTFDLVPLNTVTSGLDYANTQISPVRGVVVELRDAANTVLATSITDTQGRYGFFTGLTQTVRVRAAAHLKNVPNWEVKVIDNTGGGALYVGQTELFNNGSSSVQRDLHFNSGWGGSGYTAARAAAPFAILDAIYTSLEKFYAVDGDIVFPPLEVNWSENNNPASGNLADGDIGTSYYSQDAIYILGAEDSDSDEYDRHVVIHEWGHYFEDKLSRSDSIGGEHGGGDRLDLRVAFGEGWGNALSAMITDDRYYRDSSGSGQSQGFAVDIEKNQVTNPGWYSESSVQSILYDLYDAQSDGIDQSALGLGPIYRTLVSENYLNSTWFTSIYSFSTELKNQQSTSGVDALLSGQNITGFGADGVSETNSGGISSVLPVYRQAVVNGTALTDLCAVIEAGSYNKLGNYVFVAFEVLNAGAHTFVVTQTGTEGDAAPVPGADIDFYIYQRGAVKVHSISAAAGLEQSTNMLVADNYVMVVYPFEDDDNPLTSDTCFDLQISR